MVQCENPLWCRELKSKVFQIWKHFHLYFCNSYTFMNLNPLDATKRAQKSPYPAQTTTLNELVPYSLIRFFALEKIYLVPLVRIEMCRMYSSHQISTLIIMINIINFTHLVSYHRGFHSIISFTVPNLFISIKRFNIKLSCTFNGDLICIEPMKWSREISTEKMNRWIKYYKICALKYRW